MIGEIINKFQLKFENLDYIWEISMEKYDWKDRKKYDIGVRKTVTYLVTQKIKRIADIKKEYRISENTVRSWLKEDGTKYNDRANLTIRWKSYSKLEKALKNKGNPEVTLNITKAFYNQLVRALDGHDYLNKDKIPEEKAKEFIEFLPELYSLYNKGLITKIVQENKGLNNIEEDYSVKIDLYDNFKNIVNNFFILELISITNEMTVGINQLMKESQKILLSKKEKDINLKSEVLKEISKKTNAEVTYYLDHDTALRDLVIDDIINLKSLNIREEILVRFLLKISKTQFLINEERQRQNREQFEIIAELEKNNLSEYNSTSEVSIRATVYQFSKKNDIKTLDNEVRKMQRRIKNTFEDLKSSYPEVVKMFDSDENLLKAYVFLLLTNNKKPQDVSLKDSDIELTNSYFDKLIKKGIKERKSISVEEDKFVWNSFNTLAYYSKNKNLHEIMLYLENIYNCVYIKSIAEGIVEYKIFNFEKVHEYENRIEIQKLIDNYSKKSKVKKTEKIFKEELDQLMKDLGSHLVFDKVKKITN